MTCPVKRSAYTASFCVLLAFLFLVCGCATSPSKAFKNRVKKMSDGDLISYYHGINDRLKDIDQRVQREEAESQARTGRRRVVLSPYLLGGEGYALYKKRKVVLREMKFRNISP